MTGDSPLIEIAANSVASAVAAQAGGAGRVELCAALEVGGLTPSRAHIALARERLSIPLYVLIRPRPGDFLYDDDECETMLRDIETCAALGCDGVVLGVLNAEGDVDLARCRTLMAARGGMGLTFHRAIDVSRDPLRTLDDVIALGCERVLSSGARTCAIDGAELLAAMVRKAGDRLIVMPGAGVNSGNLRELRRHTGAREFHASAKVQLPSNMRHFTDAALGMSGGETRTDAAEVRRLVAALAVG